MAKDCVRTNTALLLPGSSRQTGPLLALPFSLGGLRYAELLSRSKSSPAFGAASLILSQQTWFILSPSDQRQGFSVTWLAFPYNSQPPAGRKQTCRRAKTYKQSRKTYSKSYDCLNIASKINTFGSCVMKTGKWKKTKIIHAVLPHSVFHSNVIKINDV